VADGVAFNHVGHCVTDLARARRFYEELLGFEVERELHPPDEPSSTLLGLPKPLGLTALYLRRDGLVLELLHFASGTKPVRERAMNEPGLTHVSLSVDDIEAVCARVAQYGGEVLADTDIGSGIFIRDPDGQLLELLPMSYREHLDAAADS
jgi:catechol 2,3-dioxygenase-like lactoylglutathione lyase family enzyme